MLVPPPPPIPLLRRVSLLGLYLHDFSLISWTFETLIQYKPSRQRHSFPLRWSGVIPEPGSLKPLCFCWLFVSLACFSEHAINPEALSQVSR